LTHSAPEDARGAPCVQGGIDPAAHQDWDDLVLNTPGHSFFHSAAWSKVLRESYGYTPLYFAARDRGRFGALFPVMEVDSVLTGRRGVSLPFTDCCEPIATSAAEFHDVFAAVIAIGKERRWKYVEIRGGDAFFENAETSAWYYGHTLALAPGAAKIFPGLRDSTRRNIKKAEKEKITVVISTLPEAMREFRRLNALTRKHHGLPPQPERFFDLVYDEIIARRRGFVSVASYDNTAIAANVYFTFGEQVIYKYGASDRVYNHLRANNLVMWEAIKWSCENGCRSMCFGRTEPENEGLRQFKAGWNVLERRINYYRYDLRRDVFTRSSGTMSPRYKGVFEKLPLPVLRMMGSLLYRHMG
jgi:hypothetical protein